MTDGTDGEIDDATLADASADASADTSNAAAVPAPVPAAPAKTCCMCGTDLTTAKRQKDSAGRYWCLPCSVLDARVTKPATDARLCTDCGVPLPPVETPAEPAKPAKPAKHAPAPSLCAECAALHDLERIQFAERRLAVTFDPESRLRAMGRFLLWTAAGFVGLAAFRYAGLGALVAWVQTLAAHYSSTRLRFDHRFDDWANVAAVLLMVAGWAVTRAAIVVRRKDRLLAYDKRLVQVENGLVALLEKHQSSTVIERSEPVRRLVHRALRRIEAAAGQGAGKADKLVATFDVRHDPRPMVEFLKSRRPGTRDLVARNREIETLAFLENDWDMAAEAVTAVLLRSPYDIDALSRQGSIYCAVGKFDEAKRNFTKVIRLATQRDDTLALADGTANLGVAHQLMDEIDDASKYHNRALFKYRDLTGHQDREADCLGNIGFIHSKKGEADKAEAVFRKALEMNRKLGRIEGMALDYGVLGLMVYNKEKGNLREAERMLRRAVALNNQIDRFGAVAAGYGNIGLVRAKKHDLKTARKMLLQAQSIYQRLNRPKMVAKVQGMLNQLSKAAPKPIGKA